MGCSAPGHQRAATKRFTSAAGLGASHRCRSDVFKTAQTLEALTRGEVRPAGLALGLGVPEGRRRVFGRENSDLKKGKSEVNTNARADVRLAAPRGAALALPARAVPSSLRFRSAPRAPRAGGSGGRRPRGGEGTGRDGTGRDGRRGPAPRCPRPQRATPDASFASPLPAAAPLPAPPLPLLLRSALCVSPPPLSVPAAGRGAQRSRSRRPPHGGRPAALAEPPPGRERRRGAERS